MEVSFRLRRTVQEDVVPKQPTSFSSRASQQSFAMIDLISQASLRRWYALYCDGVGDRLC